MWHAWMPEQSESGFPADIARIALYTTVVDADSDLALELLVDPLPHLIRHVDGIGAEWSVSVNRINADRTMKGPRKLTFVWTLLSELQLVHAIAYRTPQPEDWLSSPE
jgi:hypothetical protein